MRTPRRRRAGLLSEPGRGFCQYLALFAQDAVLAPQAMEFLALAGRQTVAAHAFIDFGLLDPLTDALDRRFELTSLLLARATCPRQLDDASPILRRVWWMTLRHGVPPSFLPSTVYQTGSSPVSRFASAKHAASYAGLVPSTFQSGERDAHGHITKRGSAELRAMLCAAAHHARRTAHPLHPYFARLGTRRGYKAAVVAVAHRLCRILFAMLRDGTDFSVTRTGLEQGAFERTITYKYRLRPKPAGRLPVAG
jgi:hypothetical protein